MEMDHHTQTTTDSSSLSLQLTSTTAPGVIFANRDELAAHYKSDWHKYNLKRKQAGLSCLLLADFQARLEAAKALQQEKQQHAGTDHLKHKGVKKRHKNKNKSHQHVENVVQVSQAAAYDRIKEQQQQAQLNEPSKEPVDVHDTKDDAVDMEVEQEQETGPSLEQLQQEAAIQIEPCQCLFDKHLSSTVQANVQRMQRKYGFFIPDVEYLTDLEGLIGYCHEKIKLGHVCLYCQRVFTTWQGCQKHMIQKNHTKLCYEPGVDLEDLSVFYDFTQANAEFLGTPNDHNNNKSSGVGNESNKVDAQEVEQEVDDAMNDDDDDEWEDISDDEPMEENPNDDETDEELDDFEEHVASMGFDVTPLGELIFPDGRIIGHRAFRRYYKQRARRRDQSTAVLAAQKAARERIYQGQVYSLGNGGNAGSNSASVRNSNALALTQAGIVPGLAAGRAGKGILVATGGGSFSQFSIYRYRAAIRKQRRGQLQGQQIHNKTKQNMNKMDKKHNRLMNGVSVAHAAR